MGIVNAIKEFSEAQGCKNAYEFWKATGLSQATAYRLYADPKAFPSRETLEVICRTFDAQPGDLLRYFPDKEEEQE
jgi:DNA-binding Xre family transcriptional regulator